MERTWIRNARLVDDRQEMMGECLLENGKIAAVGPHISKPVGSVLEIDAQGQYVFPGAVDPHVHLELPTPAGPSSDDFYSGSLAALLGGTTTLIDFVTPARGESLVDALVQRRSEAAKSVVDYTFHGGLSDWHSGSADEMRHCVEDYGLKSFKAYLAYRKTIGVDYAALKEIMMSARSLGAVVCVHCEDGPAIERLQSAFLLQGKTSPEYHALSRPPITEISAVDEVIRLCEATNCSTYLVHMSTAGSVKAIRHARQRGLPLRAETCPQYLLLDEHLYASGLPGSLAYVMSPPLRAEADRLALWKALADKTRDVVSTDHCPFTIKGQKDIGMDDFSKVPNGSAGIQTRLSLLFTHGVLSGNISMPRFVELLSTAPARCFGLYPRKGSLNPGADADLVIWNPETFQTINAASLAQRCDHTPFEGLRVQGSPEFVLRQGEIFVNKGHLLKTGGSGVFLGR